MAKGKKAEEEKEIKTEGKSLMDFKDKLKPYHQESYTLDLPGRNTNPVPGWMFEEAIRVVKLIHPTLESALKDYDQFANGEDPLQEGFCGFLKDSWDDIKPYEVPDIFKLKHTEHKRFLFNVFGVERVFQHIKPKLIATETIHKKRVNWDKTNKQFIKEFDDTYELYSVPLTNLFPELKDRSSETLYIIKMTCTTTGESHMIWVPREIGEKKDPITAIAWTFQLNISNPKRIYRQGDIIIAEYSEDSKEVTPYHLDRKGYLEKVYAET